MSQPKNAESTIDSIDRAEELSKRTRKNDPFPDIPPALLNSADIHDYVEATAMIYPYDPKYLKSSSYEAQIGSRAYFWDDEGNQRITNLDENNTVKLRPNSLVFFETLQKFYLPYYMAIRFNLRITNVHRGLLLGTGPLVDPGFQGHLLIPIHNLTNNTYTFRGGEPFIWVEFTKISPSVIWSAGDRSPRIGLYEPFPESKVDRKPWQYFENANNHNPISNAVPAALADAQESANRAKREIRVLSVGAIFAAIIAVIGFYPLITGSLDLSRNTSGLVLDLREEFEIHLESTRTPDTVADRMKSEIDSLRSALDELDRRVTEQEDLINASEIRQFQRQITEISVRLDSYQNRLDEIDAEVEVLSADAE